MTDHGRESKWNCSAHPAGRWALLTVAVLTMGGASAVALQPIDEVVQTVEREGVVASIALDRATGTVADDLTVTLAVVAPVHSTVSWPSLEPLEGQFRIANVKEEAARAAGDSLRHERRLTLEPFLPGEKVIPELTLTVILESGRRVALATPPVDVQIRTTLAGEEGELSLGDPRPVLGFKGEGRKTIRVVFLGTTAAVLGMGAIGTYLLAKRRAKREPTPIDRVHAMKDRLTLACGSSGHASIDAIDDAGTLVCDAARLVIAELSGTPVQGKTIQELRSVASTLQTAERMKLAQDSIAILESLEAQRFAGSATLEAAESCTMAIEKLDRLRHLLGDSP